MKQIKFQIKAPSSPHWVGNGFLVYPSFNEYAFSEELSPFLMFDYGPPRTIEPNSKQMGVGQHPHRGFSTVSIAWQGAVQHHDNKGNTGIVNSGDIQWMGASRGIVHEEYIAPSLCKSGGTVEFGQLWINHPASHKMDPPSYQAIESKDIPTYKFPDDSGSIRIMAGSYDGVTGPASTYSVMDVWDMSLKYKKTCSFTIPENRTTIIFVRKGRVSVCGNTISSPNTVVLTAKGTGITLVAEDDVDTAVMLLSGEPLNEPIAAQGKS